MVEIIEGHIIYKEYHPPLKSGLLSPNSLLTVLYVMFSLAHKRCDGDSSVNGSDAISVSTIGLTFYSHQNTCSFSYKFECQGINKAHEWLSTCL